MFQFQKKSEKAGIISYVFKSPLYTLTVYAVEEKTNRMEILYPVQLKATGPDIDIAPDMKLMAKTQGELLLPPGISFDRAPTLKAYLDAVPEVVAEVKQIISKIEAKQL